MDIYVVPNAPAGVMTLVGPMMILLVVRRIATKAETVTAARAWVLKDIADNRSGVEILRQRTEGPEQQKQHRKEEFLHWLDLPHHPALAKVRAADDLMLRPS